MSLLIRNARLLDPASGLDAQRNVLIHNGRIAGIADTATHFSAEQAIDASGLWLFPGVIDLASWLREPGLDHKATLK